ncbi:cytochrome c-type biogenesis protein [Parvibaculum sp.]|jgi:cytochrome c-type biogenesis protein CcmH|uniref:cytochrome c-type biogenesis protein n=1 Tax=Parvibaculum sp. TaxID=2024848 RepID=UPI000C571849|nr:cytochrome c-type biogenesis protein [Parvibaculum sp.]MAM95304.1 cytochrome C biogenesis protein CcmH [Parvibaculum sp.]HCX68202.1 cytochrome C biogenesis protein CcmH [Rhodobiaceae bacterium]
MRHILATLFLSLMLTWPALALVSPSERLSDPVQEARAREISKELRCLVCQNQSIDDSDAELAGDLRRIVRERIAAGDTDEEVFDYVVDRYGEFVLMTPRFEPATWALWLGPLLVLLVGGAVTAAFLRRKRQETGEAGLTEAEKARLAELTFAEKPRDSAS